MASLLRMMGTKLIGHRNYGHGPAVWNYLIGGVRRFERVMVRIAAGEVFRKRKSRAGAVRKPPVGPRPAFPRTKGWVGFLGWEVVGFTAQLAYQMNRPEVAAIVAASPEAQRVLRPMFRLLNIDVACVPPLPRRPRTPRSKKVSTKPKRLTRKEREAILWYPNSEGKPMKLLPRRLPRD
ncbi:MAG: hypothetical protein NT133_03970 [Alphaproteobacteria bacterium]|nr:hypothetical protein [Alphaproteobacteria bacterium]